MCSIPMVVLFFVNMNKVDYRLIDIVKAMSSSVLSLLGTTSLTIALQSGKGGPI